MCYFKPEILIGVALSGVHAKHKTPRVHFEPRFAGSHFWVVSRATPTLGVHTLRSTLSESHHTLWTTVKGDGILSEVSFAVLQWSSRAERSYTGIGLSGTRRKSMLTCVFRSTGITVTLFSHGLKLYAEITGTFQHIFLTLHWKSCRYFISKISNPVSRRRNVLLKQRSLPGDA